jgi:hypothetical protein
MAPGGGGGGAAPTGVVTGGGGGGGTALDVPEKPIKANPQSGASTHVMLDLMLALCIFISDSFS